MCYKKCNTQKYRKRLAIRPGPVAKLLGHWTGLIFSIFADIRDKAHWANKRIKKKLSFYDGLRDSYPLLAKRRFYHDFSEKYQN